MFGKKIKPELETDEQLISKIERLQAIQRQTYRSNVEYAIEAIAKRIERRNSFPGRYL